jgi:hypothetical protein
VKARRPELIALLALLILLFAGVGARLDWWSPPSSPFSGKYFFRDGFENAAGFDDLFPRDFSRWHGFQRESAAKPTFNLVALTSEVVHSGTNALKLVAAPYDGHTASKAGRATISLVALRPDHKLSACFMSASAMMSTRWLKAASSCSAAWKSPFTRDWTAIPTPTC